MSEMLKNMKLRTRLLLTFLAVGIIPFAVIGIKSLTEAADALSKQSFGQLESLREVKKAQIQEFFAERKADIDVLTETVSTLKEAAFEKLEIAQQHKKAQVEEYFRNCLRDAEVFSKNPSVADAMSQFEAISDADSGKPGGDVYEMYEKLSLAVSLKEFKEKYGYGNLYLITQDGNIVYSADKEPDQGQNLLTGPLKDSALGKCFHNALKGVAISDFEFYPPQTIAGDNYRNYSAFIAAPVIRFGELRGVIAFRLTNKSLNNIVQRRDGMGKTGETYLVGKHNHRIAFRSDITTAGEKNETYRSGREISSPYVMKALFGMPGKAIFYDFLGKLTIVSYAPLDIKDLNWAVISEINIEEAIDPGSESADEDYFTKFIKTCGYDDLYLITPEGNIFILLLMLRTMIPISSAANTLIPRLEDWSQRFWKPENSDSLILSLMPLQTESRPHLWRSLLWKMAGYA